MPKQRDSVPYACPATPFRLTVFQAQLGVDKPQEFCTLHARVDAVPEAVEARLVVGLLDIAVRQTERRVSPCWDGGSQTKALEK
jgi:hypothetical protein